MLRAFLLCLLILSGSSGIYSHSGDLVLATYVSDNIKAKHASILVRSLRDNGGEYRDSEVFIVVTDSLIDMDEVCSLQGIHVLQSDMPAEYADYPLAIKPFAAAQVERLLHGTGSVLAWFDPETIILAPPSALLPHNGKKVVAQPAFLTNNISLDPGEKPNEYWGAIYEKLNIDFNDVQTVVSLIDRKPMQAYYNCEIISVKSDEGIFQEWAEIMEELLSDSNYAYGICNSAMRMVFLHQAVLSAVIVSRAGASGTDVLPLTHGFPLHLFKDIPEERRIKSIDPIACGILENLWTESPSWISEIPLSDTLRGRMLRYFSGFSSVTCPIQ